MFGEAADTAPLKARVVEMVLLSGAFGIVFLIVNYVHFQTLPVAVILYACLYDALVAGLLVFGPYGCFRLPKGPLIVTEFALTGLASFFLVILYAVMGPTVIDRSLSIYIVEKIDHRGGAVAEVAMPKIILTEFMNEYKVSDVRMTEQLTSRTVKISDGCIRLTPRGERLAAFTRWYRQTFLPKHRRVGGEETDSLTRPYMDAPVLVPYECPEVSERTGP